MEFSLIGFSALLVLIFLRVPLAIAMGVVGTVGFALVHILSFNNSRGWDAALNMVSQTAFETGLSYELSVVPLFIVMGNLVTDGNMSANLYRASYAFLGHLKGGLALATIVACGAFSAVCGSSIATAATMSKVTMPSMRKYQYADSLATGSIAAGGTLGILIPPSVILIIYGNMTETNIGKLFMAGLLPGLLGILLYMAAVAITVHRNPEKGMPAKCASWHERLISIRQVWDIALLFVIVMGGIYGGIFTPTEAGGVGATGALLISLIRRKLTFKKCLQTLTNSVKTTAMLFALIIGAVLFSHFINIAGMPDDLKNIVFAWNLDPILVITLLVCIYIILGCVLESLSMVLLTVPVFYPVIEAMGFDLIWFGILVVVVTEISLITPPIGMNVFVLKAVVPDVKLSTIFTGVIPFWISDIVRLIMVASVPALSLFIPNLLS